MEERLNAIADRLKDKEIAVPTDLVGAVLFFVLGAVLLAVMPSQVPISENDVVNGRVFPRLLFILMMVCCGILIVQNLIKISKKEPLHTCTLNLLTEVKALIILAILFLTHLICQITDLFVVGALFCTVSFLVYFRCRKKSYYVLTMTLAVAIWAAFRFGLGVRF